MKKIFLKTDKVLSLYLQCIIFANTKKYENMAQTSMTFRVDDSLKKNFDKLCDEFGLTSTAALTVFMKAAVRERKIPFEVKTESEEEVRSRGLRAFWALREEAKKNGLTGMTLEEINEEIRAARRGE